MEIVVKGRKEPLRLGVGQFFGEVAVLPSPGRQAWLRRAAANEQRFRGQHGGLDEAETSTYLAELTR